MILLICQVVSVCSGSKSTAQGSLHLNRCSLGYSDLWLFFFW